MCIRDSPQHDSRHVFPELPLLQHTQSGGKVTVLVRESAVSLWLQSQRRRLEKCTRVGHFQKGKDCDIQEVVVGMIVPGGCTFYKLSDLQLIDNEIYGHQLPTPGSK